MVKKFIAVILCFILALSLCAYAENAQTDESTPQDAPTQMPDGTDGAYAAQGRMPGGRGGRMPGGMGGPPRGQGSFDPSQMPAPPENGAAAESTPPENVETNENFPAEFENKEQRFNADILERGGFENPRGGNFNGTMMTDDTPNEEQRTSSFTDFLKEYETPFISVILLALAFVFVIFYKRKNY